MTATHPMRQRRPAHLTERKGMRGSSTLAMTIFSAEVDQMMVKMANVGQVELEGGGERLLRRKTKIMVDLRPKPARPKRGPTPLGHKGVLIERISGFGLREQLKMRIVIQYRMSILVNLQGVALELTAFFF
jgi:hypothetical protein